MTDVNIGAGGDVTIGGDVVGRDKIEIHSYQVLPQRLVESLIVLADFIQGIATVKLAVVAFRVDFEAATGQLDRLGDLKDIHDLLHQLQYQCYAGLHEIIDRFPDDAQAVSALEQHVITLEHLLDQLQPITNRLKIADIDVSWMEDALQAWRDLQIAQEISDAALLRRVVWRLNRLLSIQPHLINARLTTAAGSLRLPSLLAALTQVDEFLAGQNLADEKAQIFHGGLQSLSQLDSRLQALLRAHECWQSVEVELRRIQALFGRDLMELRMAWPDVKAKVDPLCVPAEERWAQGLTKDASLLEAALAEDNPIRIKQAFGGYCTRVGHRFYRVDLELKALCGELRKIGAPLALILTVLS